MMGPGKRRRNKHGDGDDGVTRIITRSTGFLYRFLSALLATTRVADVMAYMYRHHYNILNVYIHVAL